MDTFGLVTQHIPRHQLTRNKHRHVLHTPVPPQPHPGGPGCPEGLGSSSVSGPCWLNVPPTVCVCMYACQPLPSLSACSMFPAGREGIGEREGGGTEEGGWECCVGGVAGRAEKG